MQGTPQMERFCENRPRHAPVSVPEAASLTPETEMRRASFVAQGGSDICLVGCWEEAIAMFPDTTKLDPQPEVESMEVEPPGIPGAMGPDAQTPSAEQNEQELEGHGALAVEDGCTQLKQVENSFPAAAAQEVAAGEPEPKAETPPAGGPRHGV